MLVPRPELVESWTEDELLAALHEATLDLGAVQKRSRRFWGTC